MVFGPPASPRPSVSVSIMVKRTPFEDCHRHYVAIRLR